VANVGREVLLGDDGDMVLEWVCCIRDMVVSLYKLVHHGDSLVLELGGDVFHGVLHEELV
jgi:hypothetical protein